MTEEFVKPEQLKSPTEKDARRILHEALGKEADSVTRFPTGLANWVYEVGTQDGKTVVVRLAHPDLKANFEGALRWYEPLLEKGVPLPELYYSEVDEAVHGFPVMIMARLPGSDLGEVYQGLSLEQKQELAKHIATIQGSVASLPKAEGYGYAKSLNDPDLLPSWDAVLQSSLSRSRDRIGQAGVFSLGLIDEVAAKVVGHQEYFSKVEPTCYLDDTTTKNVLVHEGKLSGIVDADGVAFGDPLFTVALTKMALLSADYDTSYVDSWASHLNLNEDQQCALEIYIALYCLDFMSEVGQQFNKDRPESVNEDRVKKLNDIYKQLMRG